MTQGTALDLLAGRILVVAPTERHVMALQLLLGNKINQQPAIEYEVLANAPQVSKDRLVWLQVEKPIDYSPRNTELPLTGGVKRTLKFQSQVSRVVLPGMDLRDTFLTVDTFILTDDRCTSLRDQSGMKWGAVETRTPSREVFEKYPETLKSLG